MSNDFDDATVVISTLRVSELLLSTSFITRELARMEHLLCISDNDSDNYRAPKHPRNEENVVICYTAVMQAVATGIYTAMREELSNNREALQNAVRAAPIALML